MGDITIRVPVESPDGETVIVLARPDLLDMDGINAKQAEWEEVVEELKGDEGTAPPGLFKDINDFLAEYAPPLCLSHTIGVIDSAKVPEADFYIVKDKTKLTPKLLAKRLDAVALMAMFQGIMESTASIGTAVEVGAAKSAEFRGDALLGRDGPAGDADEAAAE